MDARENYKKYVPTPERFHILYEGAKNVQGHKNNKMASALWKNVIIFDISCVQKHNKEMNVEDTTIGEDLLTLLRPEHLKFLKHKCLTDIGYQTEKLKELCLAFVSMILFPSLTVTCKLLNAPINFN